MSGDAQVISRTSNHWNFDCCPAFWDWLIQKNDEQIVFSIEAVYKELTDGNDDLSTWAKSHKNTFFLSPDNLTQDQFTTVSTWAISQDYEQTAISEFFSVGDYFLVSHALGNRMTVVTHEIPSNSKKKNKNS